MKVYMEAADKYAHGLKIHPIYTDLVKNPPADYVTLPRRTTLERIKGAVCVENLLHSRFINVWKRDMCNIEVDLIHSNQHLVANKIPWVVDSEHVGGFIDFRKYYKYNVGFFKKLAEKYLNSDYCKKVMPNTYVAKNSIIALLNIKNKEKIEVVYPAIKSKQLNKDNRYKNKIRLLYIGKRFYTKGGLEVLKAFEKLEEKYDVFLTMVSNIPKEFVKKYARSSNISFLSDVSNEYLEQQYQSADIFVLPSYMDTVGYVYLEALSFGLPVIAGDKYSTPEIIENGRTGLLISLPIHVHERDPPYQWQSWTEFKKDFMRVDKSVVVNELTKKISMLIEDDRLRDNMSRNATEIVESGKFSIKVRNEKLKRIYEEAVHR